ncbi:ABC transporter ATP-binding protein [Falsiroseomonas oryzae]|uniref:ABC transporter ATP-binding protein n=1 Tax=Falsiroseomonas oryzae TaxID=2766473 RepID=UPI0022EB6BF3|nr:ABC transporter ATP-binding protein [Roseomonas sp. MO-31]
MSVTPLRGTAAPAEAAARRDAPARLEIRDLSVVYASRQGNVKALDRLSLSVGDGEFVAVLGPSGCGKSTLLKIVSGLLRPSGGQVVLGGRPVVGPRPDVGIVFQQPTLLPWKTVLDNVLVPIRALRRPVAEYQDKAMDLLRLTGLERFAGHYPNELSGGMQQRVAVARGLIHDPALLLMDEPFAALDAMTRERMTAELQAIWMKTGKSVVFITHSIPEAVFLADRVVVLSERPGRLLETIEIDLPRPRRAQTLGEPRFAALCNRLRAFFSVDGHAQ